MKLRKANLRLLGEVSRLTGKLAIAVSALEYARDLTERRDIENCCIEALAKIKENSK